MIRQLSLHSSTVSSRVSITPGDNGSIAKNGGKCASNYAAQAGWISFGGLDLLHILQLSLHSTTVTTEIGSTPDNNGSIAKNASTCATKMASGGLDLLHSSADPARQSCHHPRRQNPVTPGHRSNNKNTLLTTLTTVIGSTPGDDGSIAKNGSK